MSSTPETRGTRVQADSTPARSVARRALGPSPDPVRSGTPAGVQASGRTDRPAPAAEPKQPRTRPASSESQMLVSFALTVVIVLIITIALPLLMSLVRNF